MMTYCSKYALLTPRNGRRKFRSPRPDPLHGVAVHLSDPVAVIVPREFAPIMVHRRMPSAAAAQRVVPVPVLGVHHRTRLGGGQDRGVDQLGRRAPMSHPEPHPATASADHPGDRRPVGLPGAVALGLVRTPPRRVVGVGVRHPLYVFYGRFPSGHNMGIAVVGRYPTGLRGRKKARAATPSPPDRSPNSHLATRPHNTTLSLIWAARVVCIVYVRCVSCKVPRRSGSHSRTTVEGDHIQRDRWT